MKRIALMVAVALIAALLTPAALAANSGKCGANINWSLNTATRTLTLSGSGKMYDYTVNNRPGWFSQIGSIDTVVVGEGITGIGECAFENNSFTQVTLPSSLQSIGVQAFQNCHNLQSVAIPAGVTIIDQWGFMNCWGLESVTFSHPALLKTIGRSAFQNATLLEEIDLPEGLETIGQDAFDLCKALRNVHIPASVTSIDSSAFLFCYALEAVDVAAGSESFRSEDGVLYNKAGTELLCYPPSRPGERYDVPRGVTGVGWYAFASAQYLVSVTLPDSVTTIRSLPQGATLRVVAGSAAHEYAQGNEFAIEFISPFDRADFILPDDLTDIKAEAFAGTDAAIVYMPGGVTRIGSRAFADCANLRHINLPDGLSAIESDAFEGCGSLYLYGAENGPAQTFADAHDSITFIPLNP